MRQGLSWRHGHARGENRAGRALFRAPGEARRDVGRLRARRSKAQRGRTCCKRCLLSREAAVQLKWMVLDARAVSETRKNEERKRQEGKKERRGGSDETT